MKKIKYKIQWPLLFIVVAGFGAMLLIANLTNPNHPQALEGNLILSATLLFFSLNYTFGTYALLNEHNKILSRTDYFFYKKQMIISDIRTIYFRPTWAVGGFARSLYIVDNNEKVVEFPNVAWHEATLARMVNDLRQINPSIKVDEHVDALVKKYEYNL